MQAISVKEQTKPSLSLNVKIIDAITHEPIENATIVLWDINNFIGYKFFTDKNGECIISGEYIEPRSRYSLYAYRGNFDEKIVDYVPVEYRVYFEKVESRNITLLLIPGALIEIWGVPYIVQSSSPEIRSMTIRVIEKDEKFLNYSFVREYGYTQTNYRIGLPNNMIIVPAGVNFILECELPYYTRRGPLLLRVSEIFYIDNNSLPFIMPQKGYLPGNQVKIPYYSLRRSLEYVKTVFADVSYVINEAQATGFVVFDEKKILSDLSQEVIKTEVLLQNAREDEEFRDIWLVLLKILKEMDNVRTILRMKYDYTESQAIYLPAVISVFSIVVSFFFFEEEKKKVISNIITYILFLIILYYTHPGAHLIVTRNIMRFLYAALFSFITFSALVFIIPRIWKERIIEGEVSWRSAITIIFSMGKRQIKRKKIRGFFTIFSIGILILAFTSLTSIGTFFGVVADKISLTSPSEGILVRQMINGSSAFFSPLGYGDIIALSEIIPATNIAQRWKNLPRATPIARLINIDTYISHFIYSIIAISPSNESLYTGLNNIVIGSYLSDRECGEVLVGSSVAEKLNIRPNQNVTLEFLETSGVTVTLTVRGLIRDDGYNNLIDVDGNFFGSFRLLEDGSIRRCNSSEIIVINLETAKWIQEIINSRYERKKEAPQLVLLSEIVFKPATMDNIEANVKRIVFKFGYDVFISLNNVVSYYHIGSYIEFKGFAELLIPMIMVILNVSMVMINNAYEREKEIKVLSMVGLNPTHIGLTFVAEAIVMGMVGGSIGYLSGLSFYRIMTLFGRDLVVREKLEWWWSAIGFALAILVSVLSAMRPAAMAVSAYTPSKIRRIKRPKEEIAKRKEEIFRAYQAKEIIMPVKVLFSEKEFFISYFLDRLYDLRTGYTERVGNIEDIPEAESVRGELIKTIKFSYYFGSPEQRKETKNILTLVKSPHEEYYRIKLVSEPVSPGIPESIIDRTIDFVHEILMGWVKDKKRIVGAYKT
ncbi:MAG: ABC transporter permease [Candidatus Bathyarchaeia archaeon]